MSALEEEGLHYRKLEYEMMREEDQARLELILLQKRRETLEIDKLLAAKKGHLSNIPKF